MRLRRTDERGFTMIELMIVVLIIGVLLAIALPVFLGAQRRANDGAVKTDVRNTFLAERVYFADGQTYTQDQAVLETIESALDYATGDTPLASGQIYVHVHLATNELFVSGRSRSGTCFYIREIDGDGAEYAASAGCGVADVQTYASGW
ncbi:MAG TPA: prepilin-type N-terminal cleavage/methylation domain-containing protein [Actinomycetota bacterium]|nr:prepilin-type N-terminal cleavage/methylation domain-containing protein [Actinomycetota bacterium]